MPMINFKDSVHRVKVSEKKLKTWLRLMKHENKRQQKKQMVRKETKMMKKEQSKRTFET